MKTHAILLAVLLVGASSPAWAQPKRPFGLTEAEYQKKKNALKVKIKRLELEYSRYKLDATGYEGVWTVVGQRTYESKKGATPKVQTLEGELTIKREDALFTMKGKIRAAGRRGAKWLGEAALDANGLEEDYDSVAGLEGVARYTLQPDGTLKFMFESKPRVQDRDAEARGQATLTRAITSTKAELETSLFVLKKEHQYLRYPRPEPTRYSSRSGKVKLRFTPTVEFDPDGVEVDVIRLIDAAKARIDLAVFEFKLPRVARALVAAKQRGVKIRVVHDSEEDDEEAIKILRDAQIPLQGDERTALMHNKFMILDRGLSDGNIVWTGSTNLSSGGIYIADNHTLYLKSEELCDLYTIEFEEMFIDKQFGPRSPSNTSKDWIRIDRYTRVQVYFAPEDGVRNRLIEAVKKAKSSIKIIAFAFTDPELFKAILDRMKEGVKVEGLFESRHAGWKDIKIGPLYAAGAKVRFDRNPDTLHHKVIIIDDKTVCTGSFNFTVSADRSNDENMIIVQSRAVARTFSRELRRMMSVADPDDPRIATSGMPKTLAEDKDGILAALAAMNGTTAPVTPAPVTPVTPPVTPVTPVTPPVTPVTPPAPATPATGSGN
ncbi:MAG: hypothetical protein JKY65_16550 [Planctomycetes bacterium]|nr:hypothetical protein [Planctomycetota bacterium]